MLPRSLSVNFNVGLHTRIQHHPKPVNSALFKTSTGRGLLSKPAWQLLVRTSDIASTSQRRGGSDTCHRCSASARSTAATSDTSSEGEQVTVFSGNDGPVLLYNPEVSVLPGRDSSSPLSSSRRDVLNPVTQLHLEQVLHGSSDASKSTAPAVHMASSHGMLQSAGAEPHAGGSDDPAVQAASCKAGSEQQASSRSRPLGSHSNLQSHSSLDSNEDLGATPAGTATKAAAAAAAVATAAAELAAEAVVAVSSKPPPLIPTISPESRATTLKAINLPAAVACISVGLAVYNYPIPAGICPKSWTVLAVFCSTVAGLVLEPLPVSAWSLCCLTTLLATRAVTFPQAMSGLTNDAIWLIVFAFFFARAFEKTGLGRRIANMFVAAVGHSTLGVAYSLACAELLMSPAMPSCTARAGGIFMPIIKFLANTAGSEPTSGRTKLGAYLVHSQLQASCNISALFMTGAAQNLLAMNIAREMGVVIPDVWLTWALGAIVPGFISAIMVPAAMYKLMPPEIKETPEAPESARQRLQQMGPPSKEERVTMVTLAIAVVLWVLGEQLDISAVLGAMVGLSLLLATGVLTWRDCLEYRPAWDTLVWFSVLVGMCSSLSSSGLITTMANMVSASLAALNLSWMAAFGLLHAAFFGIHYLFASQVGHVGALYGPFLAMMMAAGAPPTLAALTLGYSCNLFGALTHYASGPAAVYFGSGFMTLSELFATGALMGLRSLLVWAVVGMAWWKFLGWY